jgi:hypothetical protein
MLRLKVNNTHGLGFLFSIGKNGVQARVSFGLLLLMAACSGLTYALHSF